jgi:hypothetical protein
LNQDDRLGNVGARQAWNARGRYECTNRDGMTAGRADAAVVSRILVLRIAVGRVVHLHQWAMNVARMVMVPGTTGRVSMFVARRVDVLSALRLAEEHGHSRESLERERGHHEQHYEDTENRHQIEF